MNVEYIFIHTAGAFNEKENRVVDVSAASIDAYHRTKKGWRAIGYHYVIRMDGSVEKGRADNRSGAQVKGLNRKSLGICCSGHGDHEDFTPAQMATLADLCDRLLDRYGLPVERVLGHREVNGLIEEGVVSERYLTDKTCPGTEVSMLRIREAIRALRDAPAEEPPAVKTSAPEPEPTPAAPEVPAPPKAPPRTTPVAPEPSPVIASPVEVATAAAPPAVRVIAGVAGLLMLTFIVWLFWRIAQ